LRLSIRPLPDRNLKWSDVAVGGVVTAVLFTIGKSLISWYIGSSAVASSFGAAGGLIVLLLWVYYSVSDIFARGGIHQDLGGKARQQAGSSCWDRSGDAIADGWLNMDIRQGADRLNSDAARR
jgi:high-affinity Fe2+/Pb2+ permease